MAGWQVVWPGLGRTEDGRTSNTLELKGAGRIRAYPANTDPKRLLEPAMERRSMKSCHLHEIHFKSLGFKHLLMALNSTNKSSARMLRVVFVGILPQSFCMSCHDASGYLVFGSVIIIGKYSFLWKSQDWKTSWELLRWIPRRFYITWGLALLGPTGNMGKFAQYMAIYGYIWPYLAIY